MQIRVNIDRKMDRRNSDCYEYRAGDWWIQSLKTRIRICGHDVEAMILRLDSGLDRELRELTFGHGTVTHRYRTQLFRAIPCHV